MKITKCPPGVARGARLQRWQFELPDEQPEHPRRAERFALGAFSREEAAVLNTVLNYPSSISQRELEVVYGRTFRNVAQPGL